MLQTRRRVLSTIALASAAGLCRGPPARAEGQPETATLRIYNDPSICIAPARLARDILLADGFTEIRYVDVPVDLESTAKGQDPISVALARGDIDFALNFPTLYLPAIEAGLPVTVLAGLHVGCFELLAQNHVNGIGQLKGRTVGLKNAPPTLLALMAAHVGLDPERDIRWLGSATNADPLELFATGKIDAFLGFPPEPQELRARRAGHVIVNTATDRPWSQYYCCMLLGSQRFLREAPVATKRVLRALLKASDFCAADPGRAARQLVEQGFADRYDFAFETVRDLLYDKWREYDPEDTIRFYAIRMQEAGLLKSDPNKLIRRGTDWRLLNELKRELKA
jgi:NitT/TauT family transport system substrate-binding protein